MNHKQILDVLDLGIIAVDRSYCVQEWNRWMVLHSNLNQEKVIGINLFTLYPQLDDPRFMRGCKSVLTSGNVVFLSQKGHHYLFPFAVSNAHATEVEFMQQSCLMAPVRRDDGQIEGVLITVQDVTEAVISEQRLAKINWIDSLTGSYNRRHLDMRLREEVIRHRRYDHTFSIIVLDIDHFKKLNETYGSGFGDEVLRRVANVAEASLRVSDVMARYGGEEFCCFLPETGIRAAIAVAERIRAAVESSSVARDGIEASVTVSVSVAQLASHMGSAEHILAAAEKALDRAKGSGGNRVEKGE